MRTRPSRFPLNFTILSREMTSLTTRKAVWGSVLLALALALTPVASAQTPTVVTRVVDGDTIIVSGVGSVRLIGVDTPETVDPRKPVQFFVRKRAPTRAPPRRANRSDSSKTHSAGTSTGVRSPMSIYRMVRCSTPRLSGRGMDTPTRYSRSGTSSTSAGTSEKRGRLSAACGEHPRRPRHDLPLQPLLRRKRRVSVRP